MKGIISKLPVTIADRSGTRQGIVFIEIPERIQRSRIQDFRIKVQDYEVSERENPQPGEPLYRYTALKQFEDDKYRNRSKAEVDDLFTAMKTDISHTGSLFDQLDNLFVQALLLDTQQKPIRDSQPEDWEIHNTDDAIVPIMSE